MSKAILCFDPGDHTGWCYQDENGIVVGGTCQKNHLEVAECIQLHPADIVVIERFNLYPQMAKSLAWNSFYPCEVIGVIRYICMRDRIANNFEKPIWVEQAPSVKKYFGGFKDDWYRLKEICDPKQVTEHTKDAYMHYRYFLRNGGKKLGGDA